MASKKEQVQYQGRVYEDLLQDAYKAMTSSDKNPRGVWRRAEDAEDAREQLALHRRVVDRDADRAVRHHLLPTERRQPRLHEVEILEHEPYMNVELLELYTVLLFFLLQ